MTNQFQKCVKHIIVIFSFAVLSACGTDNPHSMIASAKRFLEVHDNRSAIIQLKNALQQAPDNAEARYLLGLVLLETGDPVSAQKELRKAKELNFSPDLVVVRLARAMLDNGESEQLIKEFATTRLAIPDSIADLAATIGFAYLNLGKPADAGKSFAEALASIPLHDQARLGTARLKAASMDLAGANLLVDDILTKSPKMLDALFLKSELLSVTNDRTGVSKVYERILESHPENIRAHYSRVMLSLVTQQFDLASTQLAVMKSIAPQNLQTLYLQALLALKRKDYSSAREVAQQVLKIAPTFLPGQLLAGEVEYRLSSFSQAERHLQKVLEGAPGNVAALRMLTAAYLRDGQPSRAMESLTPLLNAKLEDAGLLMLAGEVYMNNNNIAEAEKYFAKAAGLNKGNASARARLGQVLYASGDASGGLRELEAAVELDSSC